VRTALEAEIRGRVQQAAPQLVGDLWGRERVTLIITRLDVPLASGILHGEAEAWLFAESPDAFDIAAIVQAFETPIQIANTPGQLGCRARLIRIAERIEEMTASCRLTFALELTK
jgi:hypothetical protein